MGKAKLFAMIAGVETVIGGGFVGLDEGPSKCPVNFIIGDPSALQFPD